MHRIYTKHDYAKYFVVKINSTQEALLCMLTHSNFIIMKDLLMDFDKQSLYR